MSETYGSMFDVLDQLVGKEVTIFDGTTAIKGTLTEAGEALVVIEARDGLVYYDLYKIHGVKAHADPVETFGAPTVREQILDMETMGQTKDHRFMGDAQASGCAVCGDPEVMH